MARCLATTGGTQKHTDSKTTSFVLQASKFWVAHRLTDRQQGDLIIRDVFKKFPNLPMNNIFLYLELIPYHPSQTNSLAQQCTRSHSLFHLHREQFYCVRRVHGSAFHGDRCAPCREAHANVVDESACLTADNVWNEVVTIHRSQVVLKMLYSLYVDIFRN
jgi:hypothetical protein